MGAKFQEVANCPGMFQFYCKGCKCHHAVWTKPSKDIDAVWGFNDSMERPTITPSILVRWSRPSTPPVDFVCHSFITDGKIQYLTDCTHELAGQTIELPDIDEP